MSLWHNRYPSRHFYASHTRLPAMGGLGRLAPTLSTGGGRPACLRAASSMPWDRPVRDTGQATRKFAIEHIRRRQRPWAG